MIDLTQDLQPIVKELMDFWDEHPQVSDRLKRAHILALAESAQRFPVVRENAHELFYAMKTAGLLLVCEEVAPGILDELSEHYVETLKEIFPQIDFSEW